MSTGTLYIIATPIGNLGDFTMRAIETLNSVDAILAEDTRVTKTLLDHYKIAKPLISYHHHSDARKIKEIKAMLEEGKSLGLVTDAGTPGISDPGNELTAALIKYNIQIVPIPGPSAVVAALSISGFPTDKFLFLGFPPHKNKRQKFFTSVAESEHTTVFYESSHRIKKCLEALAAVAPTRQLCVARELTKKFETVYRGTAPEILQSIDERGEFVVIVNAQ